MILFVFSALLISSYDFNMSGTNVNVGSISEDICPDDSIPSDFQTDISVIKGKILPDEGFAGSMLALDGIKPEHAIEVTSTLKDHIDFRFLSAGEDFEIALDKEKNIVSSFSYMPDPVTTHKLTRNEDGYLEYELIELPTDIRYRHVSGKIVSTLNQALYDAGVTPSVAAVAYGILECIVNFRSDARKGDQFTVFLEERYFNDVKLKGGKVLLASYDGKKTGYKVAYAYRDAENNSAFNAHYSRKGEALIRAALRLPVDKVHVTSSYGQRIHPVTGKKTFHYGVDYRGAVGDPVYTVANGVVTDTGYDPVSGKKITVRHDDGTKTVYYHLSSILVKKGQKVTSRQQIAKIGRTGRVTGPHLHFGVVDHRGKWVNPMKRKMIATPKLQGERYARFLVQMEEVDNLIKEHINNEKMLARYTLIGLGGNELF
ncbi:MAG: M23 family metallopeptidase [Candidatus Delongbacteria bacterium]|nr:M23 family metallopeptidase [Candidatus Delongbacteria bacterium]